MDTVRDRIKTDNKGFRMPDRIEGQDGLAEMRTFLNEANVVLRQLQHAVGALPATGTIPANIITPPAPQQVHSSVKPSQADPAHIGPYQAPQGGPPAKIKKVREASDYRV